MSPLGASQTRSGLAGGGPLGTERRGKRRGGGRPVRAGGSARGGTRRAERPSPSARSHRDHARRRGRGSRTPVFARGVGATGPSARRPACSGHQSVRRPTGAYQCVALPKGKGAWRAPRATPPGSSPRPCGGTARPGGRAGGGPGRARAPARVRRRLRRGRRAHRPSRGSRNAVERTINRLKNYRRPPHLQRHHHRDRKRLLPPRQHSRTDRSACQGRLTAEILMVLR